MRLEHVAAIAVLVGIAYFLSRKNDDAKVSILHNTPAPAALVEVQPPGVSGSLVQTIQGAISEKVPSFDVQLAKQVQHTVAELKTVVALVLARANRQSDRLVLIGIPSGSKFEDDKGVTMYRLAFSVHDTVDMVGSRLESVVYTGPADHGTSVAHLRHAHVARPDVVAPAEESVGAHEGPMSYETPWDYARRFVFPTDAADNDATFGT